MLSDVDQQVGEAYGTKPGPDAKWPLAKRLTFLITPDGDIAKVYEVSDVAAHAGEVLQDILLRSASQ